MLFFRSEEAVRSWCGARGVEPGPQATLPQIWALSVGWYGNRLSPDARRPQPDEIRRIFDAAGLTEPAWDPLADRF